MIEYSRDAPFSPNAVVTIRTLGQEKRQFLISDMMRMSVAQHRQTYKVGCVRLVTDGRSLSHWLSAHTGLSNVSGELCQTCRLGTQHGGLLWQQPLGQRAWSCPCG